MMVMITSGEHGDRSLSSFPQNKPQNQRLFRAAIFVLHLESFSGIKAYLIYRLSKLFANFG